MLHRSQGLVSGDAFFFVSLRLAGCYNWEVLDKD